MGSKLLLEDMRDTSGCFQSEALDSLWAAIPSRFRTGELCSRNLPPEDVAAFTMDSHQRSFTLRFSQLPEPVDREMAWFCWRIVELGGRVPVGALGSLIHWMAATVAVIRSCADR